MLNVYNTQTATNDEETLIKFIQPIVAWRSAEDAVFGLSYQLKNKGIQQQFGDYSSQVTQGEVVFSMEHYAQKAAFYETRLFKYLKEYKDLFPEFISDLNKDSDIKPAKKEDTGYINQILIL